MTGGGGATFQGFFKNIIHEAEIVYQNNLEEKGDSWQTCDIEYLETRLAEEVKEFQDASLSEDKLKEILDIINMSLMLGARWSDKIHEESWRPPRR